MTHSREPAVAFPSPAAQQHFSHAERLKRKGHWREAAAALLAGLELEPGCVEGLLSLAEVCLKLNQAEGAMTALATAARRRPQDPRIWASMGDVFRSRNMPAQAAECYLSALKARPTDSNLRFAYGLSLLESDRARAAASVLRTLTAWRPSDPRVWLQLGAAARLCGEREEAVVALRRALDLDPRNPAARVELGILFRESREYDEAERIYLEALRLKPDFIPALVNLGNLYGELLRLDEADSVYAKVLALDPDHATTHCSRGMLWLLRGHFDEGWKEYEWRWRQPGAQLPMTGKPRWNGTTEISGRTVLIYAEQGSGDTIQFVRYARLLNQRGARVWLACRGELIRLMRNLPELDGVLTSGDALEGVDLYCPVLDLPGAFRTDLASIPAWRRYLEPPSDIAPDPRTLHCTGPRIGIAWAGNPNHPNDRNRSCPFELFLPVCQQAGAKVFSFQVGPAAKQLAKDWPVGVVPLAPVLEDFAATAVNLDQMDAVVTVDTSVAHLAGALGKPTAILLPYSPDWRWLLDRSDSPWYPSVTLFRQTRPGDWKGVIKQACEWVGRILSRP